jgi:hypothetical protein
MGLTYQFSFSAPAETSSQDLEKFLRSVESDAQALGFAPTTVLNVRFETSEQREFSRHLGGSCVVEDERLKGELSLRKDQVWHHHATSGTVRLVPVQGVILVVTNERGLETCFGFMKYPREVSDTNGTTILETPFKDSWTFSDFINSADPRYRALVRRFEASNYLAAEADDFVHDAEND